MILTPYAVWLALTSLLFQMLPFPGPVNSVAATGVTLTSYSGYLAPCNNTVFALGVCTGVSVTAAHNGDALVVKLEYCVGSTPTNCATNAGSDPTLNDGHNTYVLEEKLYNAVVGGAHWAESMFVATNVTAGTYSVTVNTNTGNGAYLAVWYWDLNGANTTNAYDGNSGNAGGGTSASPSLQSQGNITNSGEYAICATVTANAFTFSGSFSLLSPDTADRSAGFVSNPTAGAKVTCTGSQTSGAYILMMLAITP